MGQKSPAVSLTDAQIRNYAQYGYLIIDRLLDASDVVRLREAYDEIIEYHVRAGGDRMLGGITRQIMRPSIEHRAFQGNAAVEAGMRIASQIFDASEPKLSFDMLIYKPPGHPYETPWHQDAAYAGLPMAPAGTCFSLRTIQFWVALDDVDQENGCMHFLPGYQREPLLEHTVVSGEPYDGGRLLALVDPINQVDLNASVAAPLKAGGATIHSYGTPHYTPPNNSLDRPRRAYIFTLHNKENFQSDAFSSAKTPSNV